MKQLNLLPNELWERMYRRRFISTAIAVVVLALIGVGGLYMTVKAQVAAAEEQAAERTALEQAAAQKASQDQQQYAINPDLTNRVKQINTLSTTDINWQRFFSYVGNLLPKDIVLTSYSYGVVTNVPTLKMTGTAPSNVSFANFVETLGHAQNVTNAHVDGYTYNPTKGSVTFSISVQVPITAINYPQP